MNARKYFLYRDARGYELGVDVGEIVSFLFNAEEQVLDAQVPASEPIKVTGPDAERLARVLKASGSDLVGP